MEDLKTQNKQQWSTEETSYLMAIWSSEEVQRKLEGSTRAKAILQQLKREMASAGYDRSILQISNTLKKLKKDYRDQKKELGRSGSGRTKTSPHFDLLNSVLGDRPTSGVGCTVNSLCLSSIGLEDESFNAGISRLECSESEPPPPSACSSPVHMLGSLATTSSSSQESLVSLTQPVGRNKQVKRKRDSSSGLVPLMERSEARDEELLEHRRAMLQEVQNGNAEFLRIFNVTEQSRIEQGRIDGLARIAKAERDSHMLGLLDRMVKVMEANSKQ
ncbi:uncharacterized protein LOC117478975 isoform X1 [Trematomus bernacchii]|uniref:uncharacterized protein LOC117478975 isoform X1 n=1 Tax=Trematomus bernacchii TaxID=40690 RepID=UPI00146DBCB2|nr:uncharacterized protein LOC117478975 isoform X1 [Trematomus bernacchii]